MGKKGLRGPPPGYVSAINYQPYIYADWQAKVYGSGAGIVGRRRPPPLWARREQLAKQQNRCFYCGLAFGSWVVKRSRAIMLRTVWDHWVPYAYLQSNPARNFVAACQICNRLKRSDMFETFEEAKRVIERRRARYPIRFLGGPGEWQPSPP